MSVRRDNLKPVEDEKPPQDPAATINQVRELLFGEANRSFDERTTGLDMKIDRLAAEMTERFNQVERRMAELQAQTEERHLSAISEIGDAIVQLGTSVRNMGAIGRKR